MRRLRLIVQILVMAVLATRADEATLAKSIRDEARFTGGLIAHVGCDGGELTAALRINDRTIVHGLDDSPADVTRAREHLCSAGLHGPVSVERWFPERLPYANNMVNLLVVSSGPSSSEDSAVASRWQVASEEIARVLAPRGVALIQCPSDTSDMSDRSETRGLKGWRVYHKPVPEGIDEWTHFLHSPGNNAVARDAVVGPPTGLQWKAGPLWSKEHDVTPSVFAPVSCDGRLFYILNEGPLCTIGEDVPDRYSVVARDAFNGVLLWKRPMADWYSSRVIWGHIPMHSQRRMVAVGERVYVTLGLQSPVTALDAGTGEVVREYGGTERTSEIVCSGGKLVLVTRKTHKLDGLLAGRDGNRFRKGYTGTRGGGDEVLAVDAKMGKCLWRQRRPCMPLTLAVDGDSVLFTEPQAIVCLNLATGKEVWSTPCEVARTLVVQDGTVFVANAQPRKTMLKALDLVTGKALWTREAGPLPNFLFFFGPLDVFVAHDLVWGLTEGLDYMKRPGSGYLLGLDPRTGETRRRIPLTGAFTTEHHVRCYKGKATEDYLLFNKRGIEFINLVPGQPPVPNSYQWVRGTCRYGILPCNGLIYAPSHACACYPGAKVNGFLALSSAASAGPAPPRETIPRHVKGPAYDSPVQHSASVKTTADKSAFGNRQSEAWPTYRGNNRRSGTTPTPVPDQLSVAWETEVGGRLSSPVVAEGKVLAAAVDDYTLRAWDADDGRALWRYAAGGRIDSPPTIHEGTAIFGCRDGWVYCVRLGNGQLAWRFRAAPGVRRIGAFGRLESPWPVHGSVLIENGIAYFAAGTSSFLDGGISVCGVDAVTGELRHETRLRGPDPQAETGSVTAGRMPGAVPDILVSDETGLTMRHVRLDRRLNTPEAEEFKWGIKSDRHLLAWSGLLDDSLFNRTVWQCGIRIDRSQMLAIDGTDVYGVRVYEGISWNCPIHRIGDGHLIFRQNVGKPVRQPRPEQKKRLGRIPFERYAWHTRVPFRVCAMVLTGSATKRLFVAGVPDKIAPDDPLAFVEGRRGGRLLVLDARTGKQTAQVGLDSPPVWDGMAAAHGRLYMTTKGGKLACLTKP